MRDEKYILLTTYKRDQTPVSSPVWIVPLVDGSFGFWTSSGSGKAKRLAHTGKVMVQPCNARGVVKVGSVAQDATAHLVTGAELDAISKKVVAKYGLLTTKFTKVVGTLVGISKGKKIPYGDRGVVIRLTS